MHERDLARVDGCTSSTEQSDLPRPTPVVVDQGLSERKEQYQDWIRARIGDPTAMCAVWTERMVKEFPELRRVRGHAHTADGGNRAHWWCVTVDGEVIDPTVAQYGSCGGVQAYMPHDESGPEPVGKCSNCGGYIYPPFTSVICSDKCAREYEAYCFRG